MFFCLSLYFKIKFMKTAFFYTIFGILFFLMFAWNIKKNINFLTWILLLDSIIFFIQSLRYFIKSDIKYQNIDNKFNENTISKEEHDRLLRYISYLQEKCNTIHWHYNKYERWCKINDKH